MTMSYKLVSCTNPVQHLLAIMQSVVAFIWCCMFWCHLVW